MSKKVGIVSLTTYINYGNRLQLYATQYLLESKGFDVDVVIFDRIKKPLKRKKKKQNILKRARTERIKTFKKWSNIYLSEVHFSLNDESFIKIIETYDYMIVGSDQVWNPVHKLLPPADFLEFFPIDRKISFSSSFGVSSLSKEVFDIYKDKMKFKAISVREESGAKLIYKMLGFCPEVLVDPVLNLFSMEWQSVSRKLQCRPNDPYIFTYFLSAKKMEKMKKLQNEIQKISKNNNFKIVQINDPKNINYFKADPSEFIDFVYNSELVFTNSFHGVCFSLIFEKPFVVCPLIGGEHLNSRIDNLLDKFNLQNRKFSNLHNLVNNDALYRLKYDRSILIKEINKSHKFIESNMEANSD